MKILILKPSSLGDVVQALPVLRLLKRHHPEAEVHWWLETSLTPLLEGDPDLAGIIPFDRRRWRHPRHWHEAWASIRHLRAQHFDWILDLQSLARSGIVAWLANATLTVGLDDPREAAPAFHDLSVPRPGRLAHAVDWYLSVLPVLGIPVHHNFTWLPERPAAAAAVRDKWETEGARWIALQPGARWENKRWPAEHFAAIVRRCAAAFPDVRFAILGGAAERPLAATIAAAAPARTLNLAGGTSLTEMVEWLRLSRLLVSNDTGPLHIAAALGRPVVALFGPTEPRRTGPYGQINQVLRHPLPCSPCLKDTCRHPHPLECLHGITPDLVATRIAQHLHAPAPGHPE